MKVKSRGNNIHLYVGAITVDLGDDPLEVVDLARRLLGKAIRIQRAATGSAGPVDRSGKESESTVAEPPPEEWIRTE